MKIFNETRPDLLNFTEGVRSRMRQKIRDENEIYILNVNETKYIDFVENEFTIEDLLIDFDAISVTRGEKEIAAERFPGRGFRFDVQSGRKYKKRVITYHIPYSGNVELLKYQPGTHYPSTPEVNVSDGEIKFEVIDFYNDNVKVKAEADENIKVIKDQFGFVKQDIDYFNSTLRSSVEKVFKSHKQKILDENSYLLSLGVPIKKVENQSSTFAVPTIQKKVIVKPSAPTAQYKPEPTIDDDTYKQIILTLVELGKAMERSPSLYSGKDEEALRDVFLMQLTLHFQSATGETFNKVGKTDILLRHDNENVFVAECKIWKGESVYTSAIDQLLSYLTWRDTKTALMMFVPNKDITSVLEQIKPITRKHPCFVKLIGDSSQGQYDFEFHLPGDPNRSVQISVLCFHFVKS